MKPVDGLIAAAALAVLALAGTVVYRAHHQSRANTPANLPSALASPPASDDFPSCMHLSKADARTRCEISVARNKGQLRCVGGRLYYARPTPDGDTQYHPWPASFSCWNQGADK